MLLLNLPYVQQRFSILLSKQLSLVLGSRLDIGKVNLGLLNRVIIDDLYLEDLSGKEMLKVSRLSAKLDILPLFNGEISISNIQLFGFNISLKKDTPESDPNFQFVINALASKDTVKTEKDLHLRINSLLIRRGEVTYDVLSEETTPGKFNPNHLRLNNIIATLSLKALQNDSINAAIKRLSIEEQNSGFLLKKLSLRLVGNEQGMIVDNFSIELPRTSIQADTLHVKYDSLEAFKDPIHKLRFSFHMKPSQVTLQDLAPFLPVFSSFKAPLQAEIMANGTINQLNCSRLAISAPHNHFFLRGDASFQDLSHPADAYVFANVSRLHADPEGIVFLTQNLSNNSQHASILPNLGTVSFHGELSGYFTDLVTYGLLRTDLGNIKTDVKITSDKSNGYLAYSGEVETEDFDMGSLLTNEKLGKITFQLKVNGKHRQHQYPQILMKGLVSSIDYSQYSYKNITLDGEYKQGGFNGEVALNDINGTILLNGAINTAGKIPTFNFLASIDHVRPHDLLLTPNKYEGAEFSAKLKADFTGKSIDDLDGEINVDSLSFVSPEKNFFLDNFKIKAGKKNASERALIIQSNFLDGNITGDYSYHTLPSSFLNIIRRYIPALSVSDDHPTSKQTENNFNFNLHIYNTDLLAALFDIPLKVYTHSTVKGYFNDASHHLRIEGYFPRLRYKNMFIESAMLLCENPHDQFRSTFRFTNRKAQSSVNVSLDAYAQNDSIRTTLNWGNSSNVTYSGRLATLTRLVRKSEADSLQHASAHKKTRTRLRTVIDIEPTDIILNDTLWNIHPASVVIDSGKVHINDFNFSHKERHLSINGVLSKSPEDTVRIDLEDINIGYVFDIANLGVNFQGEATGPALASGVLSKPVMSTDLLIRNLGLNNGLLGDAWIHGEWHNDVKGIWLDAHIREQDTAQTHVQGFIYPVKPTSALDLRIKADGTNLKFIHHYMQSITSDFNGRVWGDVHFYGKFKALTLEGRVKGDASLKVDVLNTTYNIKDSILITPNGLTLRNNRIFDTQGHQGHANGYLHYQHFKNLEYRFNFGVNNMLVMNTTESLDFPFYGTVYGTGNASIAGNVNDGVNIDVAMTTNPNTRFTYIKDNVTSAVSNQFIRFVDKTPRRVIHDTTLSDYEMAQQEMVAEEEESETDIRLNLLIDATPDATMSIIMDPVAGDYISARGSGNIRTEFYNKGDVKMFGNYKIDQGIYKFSLQEVIRKDFAIDEGSTLAFNGSPLDAFLNIRASYTVNSASLNDLIPNANEYVNQTNVKVNCIMNISGQLTSPDIKLDLELPNEREEVQALVRNYISTDEQKSTQILYLLGIGKFYMPENIGTVQNSDMMSSVLSSTLSGQLNNALANIINNNNWNIGTNFSTGQKGWTDMEFEGMLSGQLLNNRLLINGNFGYQDNPLSNTNFVGDFEAEWLVNRSGDIRLKAYNETNDRYYIRTNLTTQGIGIIFKKDFERWADLLFWKKWKLRRLEKKLKKEAQADTLEQKKDTTMSRPSSAH